MNSGSGSPVVLCLAHSSNFVFLFPSRFRYSRFFASPREFQIDSVYPFLQKRLSGILIGIASTLLINLEENLHFNDIE